MSNPKLAITIMVVKVTGRFAPLTFATRTFRPLDFSPLVRFTPRTFRRAGLKCGCADLQMCRCSNVSNADVDAGKDPHFTNTRYVLHSRY